MEHRHNISSIEKHDSAISNTPHTLVKRDAHGAACLSAVVLKGANINVKNVDKEHTTDGYVYISSKNREEYALLRNIEPSKMHLSLDMGKHDDSGKFSIRNVSTDDCLDQTTTLFTVQGDKVGINTNSPTTNLDVVGSVKISKNLDVLEKIINIKHH